MKIVFCRIDERLIHGQITISWANLTGTRLILAINDQVANNHLQKNLIKMAAPAGIDVEVLTVEEAKQKITGDAGDQTATMILVKNPIDMLELINSGLDIKKINIGGVRQPTASIVITKEVKATPEELKAWKELAAKDITMEVQFTADQTITNLNKLLNNF